MAVIRRVLVVLTVVSALALVGCGSNADTDTSTTGLKAPLPEAKPGAVVDPPDPSKGGEGPGGLPTGK